MKEPEVTRRITFIDWKGQNYQTTAAIEIPRPGDFYNLAATNTDATKILMVGVVERVLYESHIMDRGYVMQFITIEIGRDLHHRDQLWYKQIATYTESAEKGQSDG